MKTGERILVFLELVGYLGLAVVVALIAAGVAEQGL